MNMIISVSRRTDIPSYYSDWFFNRLREGFVTTRNPMNYSQVKQISLTVTDVDCFVFWTKNPAPMLLNLSQLDKYSYYFQFTITPYENDIELNLPNKSEIISTFKRLSEMIGKERVIWRYDPIFINEKYTLDYHVQSFDKMAEQLSGYTDTVIISFIDLYSKFLKRFPVNEMATDEKIFIAKCFSKIAEENNIAVKTCAESEDLTNYNIQHASCIDKELIEKLINRKLNTKKDRNQRPACGCVSGVDIGVYNTCLNGCLYCYANYSESSIKANFTKHDPVFPGLF